MTTAIVDYGSGNLRSAEKAFQRMSLEAGGGPITVTADPDAVALADRVVLPGVGAFADCRAGLMAIPGMLDAIAERVGAGCPFLGICVGMQLMATRGLEHGPTPGFGWIGGEVVRLVPADPALKVPHMGWNELVVGHSHPVLAGIATGDHAYFVHSYQLLPARPGGQARACRLWRTRHGRGRPRHHGRHAVPPGEEPGDRPAADSQLPALAPLSAACPVLTARGASSATCRSARRARSPRRPACRPAAPSRSGRPCPRRPSRCGRRSRRRGRPAPCPR